MHTSMPPVADGPQQWAATTIPHFEFPWPSACAPEVEQLELSMIDWAQSHGLFLSKDHRLRAARARAAWLAARSYPYAKRHMLHYLANYILWLFLADDMLVDRIDVALAPTVPPLTAILDVLDFNRIREKPTYGEAALLDICLHLQQWLPAEHFQRFANGMRLWVSSAGLQILNHLNKLPPSMQTYMAVRRYIGAVYPAIDLCDSANAGPLPAADYYRPGVQQLRFHINNIICWSNDVHSVGIEMKQPGQFWNMVTIYISQGETPQSAIDCTCKKIRDETDLFLTLAATIEHDADHLLRHYIRGMKDWLRGYFDWMEQDTQRYSPQFAELDADDRSFAHPILSAGQQ